MQFHCLKSVIDIRVPASDQKRVEMSCTIKATRTYIYYCAIDKLCILRIERWGLNAQKPPDGD